ncbi:MAG: signal peptide peptidase SppA [Phycisphaerales bacterium]|nr:signal peptide peptidase SppA [Phycisphaerales bacterium]
MNRLITRVRHTCHAAFFAGAAIVLMTLAGCANRTVQINLVPTHAGIRPQVVHRSSHWFVCNRIAIVRISGMLADGRSGGLFGSGHNPVSDLRQTLDRIAHDPRVKAVILRLNTPGGTVTASAMMYHDILTFKKKTHLPVIASMMDLCASGGYYISCASDYQMAYPTTITASIGVIVQLFNFHKSLGYLGIQAPVFVSGKNKDTASPFHRMSASQRAIVQGFVNQFYARFLGIAKKTHPLVPAKNWSWLADGRPMTGTDAARYHLINGLGNLDDAIALAKKMAHIHHANIVLYSRSSHGHGSIYAHSQPLHTGEEFNMFNINMNPSAAAAMLHPTFLYMWEN